MLGLTLTEKIEKIVYKEENRDDATTELLGTILKKLSEKYYEDNLYTNIYYMMNLFLQHIDSLEGLDKKMLAGGLHEEIKEWFEKSGDIQISGYSD